MAKYNIYAGLGENFLNTDLGPTLQMTRDFSSEAEARKFAKEIAINRYQYYEGQYDIFSWIQCKNYITKEFPYIDWTFDDITEFYEEEINHLIVYYVEEYKEN